MKRVRVLLINLEKNDAVTDVLKRYIIEEGYEFSAASGFEEGFQMACTSKPDVIALNVLMHVAEGFQVCDIPHKDKRTSGIPIILETARGDKQTRLRGYMAGANKFLKVPFSPDDLIEAIKAATGGR